MTRFRRFEHEYGTAKLGRKKQRYHPQKHLQNQEKEKAGWGSRWLVYLLHSCGTFCDDLGHDARRERVGQAHRQLPANATLPGEIGLGPAAFQTGCLDPVKRLGGQTPLGCKVRDPDQQKTSVANSEGARSL